MKTCSAICFELNIKGAVNEVQDCIIYFLCAFSGPFIAASFDELIFKTDFACGDILYYNNCVFLSTDKYLSAQTWYFC